VRTRRLIAVLAIVAFVAFSGGLKRTLLVRTSREVGHVVVGTVAPDFTLPDLEGRAVSLHELAAQHDVTLVTFWATWCLPCRLEMPELAGAWKDNHGDGLELLAVNTEKDAGKARAFAQERALPFPVLLDDGSVQQRFGIEVLPSSFMVDRRAKVLWAHTGSLQALTTVTTFQLRRIHERDKEESKKPRKVEKDHG
jgi:peroxiredoxin